MGDTLGERLVLLPVTFGLNSPHSSETKTPYEVRLRLVLSVKERGTGQDQGEIPLLPSSSRSSSPMEAPRENFLKKFRRKFHRLPLPY